MLIPPNVTNQWDHRNCQLFFLPSFFCLIVLLFSFKHVPLNYQTRETGRCRHQMDLNSRMKQSTAVTQDLNSVKAMGGASVDLV